MRRTLTGCRAGLATAAAVVLLTGCSGSDEKSASSSSSARSSAAATTASGAASQFCTQAAAVESTIASALANQSDLSSVAPALQTAVTQIRTIDPPSEIATDWGALADGIEQVAAAFGKTDVSNPSALATLQQQATQLEAQLSAPAANVQKYLATTCGLGTSTTTASPTS